MRATSPRRRSGPGRRPAFDMPGGGDRLVHWEQVLPVVITPDMDVPANVAEANGWVTLAQFCAVTGMNYGRLSYLSRQFKNAPNHRFPQVRARLNCGQGSRAHLYDGLEIADWLTTRATRWRPGLNWNGEQS